MECCVGVPTATVLQIVTFYTVAKKNFKKLTFRSVVLRRKFGESLFKLSLLSLPTEVLNHVCLEHIFLYCLNIFISITEGVASTL